MHPLANFKHGMLFKLFLLSSSSVICYATHLLLISFFYVCDCVQ